MHTDRSRVNLVSEQMIGGAFRVVNTLGTGFLEKPYENALAHELREGGLAVVQQHGIAVRYHGIVVGECAVDLPVEEGVMVELKVVRTLDDVPAAQCINYLKAIGLRLCLLINSDEPRLEVRQFAHGT